MYTATQKDVNFLNSRGRSVKTVEDAQTFLDKLHADDLASYQADLAANPNRPLNDADALARETPNYPGTLVNRELYPNDTPVHPAYRTGETVTMLFPKAVVLTLDPPMVGSGEGQFPNKKFTFGAGVQEV